MENGTALQPARRGLSASALKTIAILAMTVDHIAWAFVPTYSALGIAMHFVGRITGPTMFYFIAEGYHHTSNPWRYTLRLGLFALASYLPYIYFEYGTLPTAQAYEPFGVIYTLFLGLLAIRARHELKNPLLQVAVIVGLVFLSDFGDWGVLGVLYILVFDYFRGNYLLQVGCAGIIVAATTIPQLFYDPLASLMQFGQVLPLVLLYFYNGKLGRGGRAGKWFFYIYYPAHLVALGLLKALLL